MRNFLDNKKISENLLLQEWSTIGLNQKGYLLNGTLCLFECVHFMLREMDTDNIQGQSRSLKHLHHTHNSIAVQSVSKRQHTFHIRLD